MALLTGLSSALMSWELVCVICPVFVTTVEITMEIRFCTRPHGFWKDTWFKPLSPDKGSGKAKPGLT